MEFYKVDKVLGNLVNDNVKKLESLFPLVVKDGEVDFEELKELLGDFEEVDKEKYEMNWVGKKEAKKLALTPLYGKTLKYVEDDGKNEDTTENLYIEGDNLEVLKLLQNSYYGKVKMIYIDPPYNTGNDFIYDDKFKVEKDTMEIFEGDRNEYGERLIKNQKSSSHYHSKWLSMMYSRLLVCKNLLNNEGIIFISIDDTEQANLKKICDEIFGEHNFIANFLWKKKSTSTNTTNSRVSSLTDFILVYSKNDTNISIKPRVVSKETRTYNFSDELGNYRTTIIEKKDSGEYKRETMKYKILGQHPRYGKRWQIGEEKARELEMKNRFFIDDSGVVKLKIYDFEDENTTSAHPNLLDKVGSTDSASKYVNNKLFNVEGLFSNPKPIELIKYFIEISTDEDSIIMDFFSGSSTTADALIHSELEETLNRKFIMVQLPEQTEEKSEAYRSGYKNICEIGKERIRRAGDKILEENKNNPQVSNLDIGFKVFRVEDSNIKWESRINEDDQLKYNLNGVDLDDIDFMPNTKDIDVVYEVLLRHYGIPITSKIDKLDVIGERTYTIANSIIVCLETKITQEIIDKISELEPIKVIFRDSAFGEDISLKQNSIHRLNVLIEKNNKNTTHVVEFI